MKIKSTVLFLFFSILAFGQSPEKFTYQSIIKNSSGYLLKNQEVGLRISILFNSSNGAEVYSEEHFPTSNSNGLVTVIIGEGLTGDNISNIDWGNGEYFIKVEVDPEGGINYTMNQTSQLLSVPYALYAENSGSGLNLLGQDFITLSNQTLTVNKVDLADDVDGILPITNGGTGSDTAPMVGVITAADEAAARSVLGLGTAAITASMDYATAAQGAKADTALQAANNLSDLADAATSRTNLGLGTAAITASTDYATAAQGALADSAQQPPSEGAFTDGDKSKLDGIAASANNYSLPDATSTTLGGIKVGTNLSIDSNGVLSSTDTNTTYSVGDGGLTQNNFTDALKSKLDNAVLTTGDQSIAGEKTFTSKMTATNIVNLASSGVMTTVKGTLNVDEAVTFDSTLDVTGDTSVKGLVATGKVITPSGTTGNQTINAIAGSVNFSSSATTLTVTNNLVNADSVIMLTKGTPINGGTAIRNMHVIPASGEFTIHLDFSFARETKVYFFVIN